MKATSQTGKRVGIWIRVSTDLQVEGESPERHEERARAYALGKGWEVAEVYRLDAVSGKSVMGHHVAVRMLRDVRAGRISALVFSKLAGAGYHGPSAEDAWERILPFFDTHLGSAEGRVEEREA